MGLAGRIGVSVDAFRSTRANRSLRLLQLARLASVTGRWAYTVTLAVYAFRVDGATGVAVAALVRLGPAALTAPLTGTLLGRARPGTLLLQAGLLRTVALASAGLLALGGRPVWLVYLCVALESAVSATVRPIQQSLLPSLSRTPDELTSTNLALSVIESVGVLFGPLCGAALLRSTSVGTVFLVSAGAYLVSALLQLPMSRGERVAEPPPPRTGDALSGLRVVASDKDTRIVLTLYGAQSLVAGALNVLVVVTALRLLELGQTGVGTLTASIGVGGVIGGGLVLARLHVGDHGADLAIGLVLWGIPLVLLSFVSSELLALLLLAVVGVGVTVVDVAAVTLLQRVADNELLAHALGLLQAILVTAVGIGTVAAPALVAALGVRGALLAAGVPLPLLAAALWRRLRVLDRRAAAGSQWLAVLNANAIFTPLSRAAREHLVGRLEELPMRAGDVIMRQGDPGDAFFLVAAGSVEVEVDGSVVNRLHEGDGFGEIALLRDVPRTATVRALAGGTLLRLEREPFLATVTGNRSASRAAESLAGARLGLSGGLTVA